MSSFRFIFRETPLACDRQAGRYSFVLGSPLDFRIPGESFPRHAFAERGILRGEIWGSRLRIFPGYAIDGCSPSIVHGNVRLGTPTPKSSLSGAFAHDFLYQFLPLACSPWTREDADAALLSLLDHEGFPFGLTYFLGVRAFGGLFAKRRGSNPNLSCLTCETP